MLENLHIHLASAIMETEASVAAAMAYVAKDSGSASKRARGAETSASSSAGSGPDKELLTKLLRSHLIQGNLLLDVANATSLCLLIRTEAVQQKLLKLVDAWHAKQKEHMASSDRSKPVAHEWGPKRVFCMQILIAELLTSLDGADAPMECLQKLKSFKPAELEFAFAACGPEFAQPKAGRPWKWKIVFGPLCPEHVRQLLQPLCMHLRRGANSDWMLEPSHRAQTELTKELWDELKARTPK